LEDSDVLKQGLLGGVHHRRSNLQRRRKDLDKVEPGELNMKKGREG
jgi:hypothetical protein